MDVASMVKTGQGLGLPETIDERSHFFQLYDGDGTVLAQTVAKYLADGFARRSVGVVIATRQRHAQLRAALVEHGYDAVALIAQERLLALDAADTLAEFMVNGHPDADRFELHVGSFVRRTIVRAGLPGIRAYGEMVGLLWQQRQYPAAIRLEQLWNALRDEVPFALMCAYPIDVFSREFDGGVMDALFCAHTHLLPSGLPEALERAMRRAMVEVLGSDAADAAGTKAALRTAWGPMPKAEATILWLRKTMPDRVEDILDRARRYYHSTA